MRLQNKLCAINKIENTAMIHPVMESIQEGAMKHEQKCWRLGQELEDIRLRQTKKDMLL